MQSRFRVENSLYAGAPPYVFSYRGGEYLWKAGLQLVRGFRLAFQIIWTANPRTSISNLLGISLDIASKFCAPKTHFGCEALLPACSRDADARRTMNKQGDVCFGEHQIRRSL